MNEELEVDGDLCVHGLSPSATCRRCVDICPQQAFVLDDDILGFDTEACDGCGLCRPACPQAAIILPIDWPLREGERDQLALMAACEKTEADQCKVACVHALAPADLQPLLKRGLRHIVLWAGDCHNCARATGKPVGERLQIFNQWRASRGYGRISLRLVDAKGWQAALRRHERPAETVDPSRRNLLGAFRSRSQTATTASPASSEGEGADKPQPQRLYMHRPEINPATCSGCDACLHVCPHDCLRLQRNAGDSFYALDPERCSGCGLCVDVCAEKAMSLHGFGPLQQPRLALLEAKCPKCGAPFHQPQRDGETPGQCRICKKNDPTSRLFQVY